MGRKSFIEKVKDVLYELLCILMICGPIIICIVLVIVNIINSKNNSRSSTGSSRTTIEESISQTNRNREYSEPEFHKQELCGMDEYVWISTKSGSHKYHYSPTCSAMDNPIRVTRRQAEEDYDKTACLKCWNVN